MTRRTTVHDPRSRKGQGKWPRLRVDDAEGGGNDILSCEPVRHLYGIRTAAPTAFRSVGMRRHGADSVYGSNSSPFIAAMAHEGIPVTGHVGLVPRRATWTHFRAAGRTPEDAAKVLRAVQDVENAGTACVAIEPIDKDDAAFDRFLTLARSP